VPEASFVSAVLEIRAPRFQVQSVAARASSASDWLWAPAQVASVASRKDLENGGVQLLLADGDKIVDRVISAEAERVVLESKLAPRKAGVPGRQLRYELALEPGAATTRVTLGLAFVDRPAPAEQVELRKWRRHAEQCLARLAALATAGQQQAPDRRGMEPVGEA
jgi:succinylarginine dihydrolase